MGATKIATCCYCGTKAALVLRGKDRHELTCGKCGAPLHALKMLPMSASRPTAPAATPSRPAPRQRVDQHSERVVSRPTKRRKTNSFGRKVMSGIWDVIEAVGDEVFD
jgi:hypothetical protein